ncbi:MAG: NAD(P)/FAD-dependent oxidoreductase [Halobacteriales archaeon]
MERVDVAVVGGGPAGSAAAHAAASGGAETVVIEKGVPRADREGLGPDSTDAAGILDYWVDIMGISPAEMPEDIIYRDLDRAEFIGPTESVTLTDTGIASSYPDFGFTYDRAAFDDWMRERAEEAGAEYRVGSPVTDVTTDLTGGPTHTIALGDGAEIEATYLILADGPQRTVTLPVLDQFLGSRSADEVLDATEANHIAYQEYRELPEELFDPDSIKFWWGYMPGDTAYPWIFPNDGRVARVGLTMPIDLDLGAVENREEYRLLRPEDDRVPSGGEYIERLLETVYPEHDLADFPRVEGRGKRDGTETYPISSTRPIDSPTAANVAVTGGAMGATSAFHEGGAHVAIRTGSVAGRLAAEGSLDRYNDAWKRAVGDEVRRNVAMADLVREFGPADWDQTFGVARRMLEAGAEGGITLLRGSRAGGLAGLKLAAGYQWRKFRFRDGRIAQLRESAYSV